MLEGEKVTNGNSKITMTLSYEDESGNISETTKDFELEVTEAVDDSDMYMNTDGDVEAGSGGFPVVPVVVVIAIIVGAVAVSYTHLDVYKRQGKTGQCIRIIENAL